MGGKGNNAITSTTLEAIKETSEEVARHTAERVLEDAGISSDAMSSEDGATPFADIANYVTKGDLKDALKIKCFDCQENGAMNKVLTKLDGIQATINQWRGEKIVSRQWTGRLTKVGLAVLGAAVTVLLGNALSQMHAARAAQESTVKEMQMFLAQQKAAQTKAAP